MWPLLGGLGSSLLGGLASSFGDKLGEKLGLTPDVGATPAMQGMQLGLQQAAQQAPGILQSTQSNALGMFGDQAAREAQMRVSGLTGSISARRDAEAIRQSGQQGVSSALGQGNIANLLMQRSLGGLKGQVSSMLGRGGTAASTAGALGGVGNLISQGVGRNLMMSGANMQSALGQQAQGRSAAQGIQQADLANRFRTQVQPSLVQQNPAALGFASNLAGIGGQAGATQARTNPLAGLAGGFGLMGGGLMQNWLGGQLTGSDLTGQGQPGSDNRLLQGG